MAVKIGETAMGRGQRYKSVCVRLQHSVGELAVFRTEGSHERRDEMTPPRQWELTGGPESPLRRRNPGGAAAPIADSDASGLFVALRDFPRHD